MNTMETLISQKDFLTKYNIPKGDFEKTTLTWKKLKEIYSDYSAKRAELDNVLTPVVNTLMKISNVHSVRYRTKDPEHLIEKIIRKRIDKPERVITIENYQDELTDLIGIRVMHLFKTQWKEIHDFITLTWHTKEKPVIYYREGDQQQYDEIAKANGCEANKHNFGYRSVHYIIQTQPAKRLHYVEIQVRTIFEEGWSEIDHTIRYPYDQGNLFYGQFLSILNRLAGSADEMGTFVSNLKNYFIEVDKIQNEKDIQHQQEMTLQKEEQRKKDKEIKELKNEIKLLKLPKEKEKEMMDKVDRIRTHESFPSMVYPIAGAGVGLAAPFALAGVEGVRAASLVFENFHNLAIASGAFITAVEPIALGAASLTGAFFPATLSAPRICTSCGEYFTIYGDKPTGSNLCQICETKGRLTSSIGAQ